MSCAFEGQLLLVVTLTGHAAIVVTLVQYRRNPGVRLLRRVRLLAGLTVALGLLTGLLTQLWHWHVVLMPIGGDAFERVALVRHAVEEAVKSAYLALLGCIFPAIVWATAALKERRSSGDLTRSDP
ncbi:hypothetical protein JYT86_00650 [bacterium AH-315-N03]|nr:hypothetical protein [bacterium AH-315-N03]